MARVGERAATEPAPCVVGLAAASGAPVRQRVTVAGLLTGDVVAALTRPAPRDQIRR